MGLTTSERSEHDTASRRARFDPIDFEDPPAETASRLDVVAIAVLAGLGAAVGGPSPTGSAGIDVVLVVSAVAATTWFASVLKVRTAAILALVAGCATVSWIGLAVGGLAYVTSIGSAVYAPRRPWLGAALIAVALNLAVRSRLEWFFGASAVAGVCIAVVAVVLAAPAHQRRRRRRVFTIVGIVVVLAGAAGGLLASVANGARVDLQDGERTVREGLDQLLAGEVDQAVESFRLAGGSFDRAHERLSGPSTAPAALVPVAAQHRTAALELTEQAQLAADTLMTQVGTIDLDDLTFDNGRIDVDAIAALSEPLAAVRSDMSALQQAVAEIDDPWLVEPLRERMASLGDEITEQLARSDQFVDIVDLAPAMLGRDGPRHYFVGFTTPSEVRGLGGFLGNFAEVTIDDGAIDLSQFGRADTLDAAAAPGERTISGPDDWLARYGTYGFDNVDGGTGPVPWKNITMSASMESTGQVIADLYAQSGGRDVDGVFIMDVYAVAALLELTGPIELPDGEGTVTAQTAPRFLLKGQYDQANTDDRIDLLEIVSTRVFETLLESELPAPLDLLDLPGPLVEEGRISGYAIDLDEQALIDQVGLSGTLQTPDGNDALAITFNNAVGNKIDFFLDTSATYQVSADQASGQVDATLDLVLENRSPADGQPFYVIGNLIDQPFGSNRSLVSVYSQLPLERALVDGAEVIAERTVEAGYFVTGVVVDLEPGGTGTVRLEFAGQLDVDDGYELAVRTPPLADAMNLTVDATLVPNAGSERTDRIQVDQAGLHTLRIDAPSVLPG
ncbi:MAG: DUF4012 domain-containing protein [Ilumatobacter sp.]